MNEATKKVDPKKKADPKKTNAKPDFFNMKKGPGASKPKGKGMAGGKGC